MRALTAVLIVVATGCGRDAPAPTCKDVAARVRELLAADGDIAADLHDVFVERCRDDAWSVAMRACVLGTTDLANGRACRQQLTAEQSARLDRDVAAAERRDRERRMPSVCVAYERTLARLSCPALTDELRSQLGQQLAAARTRWIEGFDEDRLIGMCASALQTVQQICR